jgi:hypothetical protein
MNQINTQKLIQSNEFELRVLEPKMVDTNFINYLQQSMRKKYSQVENLIEIK